MCKLKEGNKNFQRSQFEVEFKNNISSNNIIDGDFCSFKQYLKDNYIISESNKTESLLKKAKYEDLLPYTVHPKILILPNFWVINRESQQIYQLIEKKLINGEREIKKKLISEILHEARLKFHSNLKEVTISILFFIKQYIFDFFSYRNLV